MVYCGKLLGGTETRLRGGGALPAGVTGGASAMLNCALIVGYHCCAAAKRAAIKEKF